MRKWMKTGLVALLAAFCWVAIAQGEVLRIGFDRNFRPFGFFDENGKLTGFDVELWEAVAGDLKVGHRWVPMDFKDLLPALKDGRLDAAIAGITITAAREKEIDFAYPYFQSGLHLMVRSGDQRVSGIGDLDDKVVATKAGTTSVELAKNIQTRGVKLFPDIQEAFDALLRKEADAVLFDAPILLHFSQDRGKGKVEVVGPLYHRHCYGIGFPPESRWRDPVSVSLLKLMEEGSYSLIYRKWFGSAPGDIR